MELLFAHSPKMSLTDVFHNAELNQNYELIESIKEHMPEGAEDVCYICFCYEPSETILRQVCSCKSIVHATCLTKLIGQHRICKVCQVCQSRYKTNQRRFKISDSGQKIWDDVVFFPYEDLYYPIGFRPILFKAAGLGVIQFAILFLQTKRLGELLLAKSHVESEIIYFQNDFRTVCKLLKTSLPNNYSKVYNRRSYIQAKLIINVWCLAHGFAILFKKY